MADAHPARGPGATRGLAGGASGAGLIYQQQASPFHIHYRPVVLPPARHRAYALQWGLLALAVVAVALAASARRVPGRFRGDRA